MWEVDSTTLSARITHKFKIRIPSMLWVHAAREEQSLGVKPLGKPTEAAPTRLDRVFSLTLVSSVTSVEVRSAA